MVHCAGEWTRLRGDEWGALVVQMEQLGADTEREDEAAHTTEVSAWLADSFVGKVTSGSASAGLSTICPLDCSPEAAEELV